jgi:rare lipoprotein A
MTLEYTCNITSEIMKKFIVALTTAALTTASFLPGVAQAASRSQCGQASYYGLGDGYQGGTTASGRRFDTWSNQAAHRWLPFGTVVTVTANGRSTRAIITDRGPFAGGRIIDLSAASFSALAPLSRGVQNVCISW